MAALTAKQLAPSTVHTVYAVLRSLMQSAVEDQLIAANPCSRVPLPRLDKRVVVPLPAAAVSALATAMSPRYELAVWLAAGAGLREGEALGLTVPRVEFLARRLVSAGRSGKGRGNGRWSNKRPIACPAGDAEPDILRAFTSATGPIISRAESAFSAALDPNGTTDATSAATVNGIQASE